jgi:translocation and assembly module TamA
MSLQSRQRVLGCCSLLALGCWSLAQAAIRVEIEGVDAELRRNVSALLSLERYKDRERIEPDAVERLYRRVDDEVRSALRPFGYYEPTINSTLEPDERQRNWRVRITIATGQPVLIGEVSIIVRGPGGTDPNFTRLTTNPLLQRGQRLQHAVYEQTKTNLQRVAASYGYLDARMLRNELLVDPAKRQADIYLEIETGERYRFGPTSFDQGVIRDVQARRYLRYGEGDPYDAGKWLRTQFALDDSQYFSTVEVTLGERDTVNHVVPMHIRAEPARSRYPLAAGYGSDTGVRGSVGWVNPHINSLGHRLWLQLQASEVRQSFNARYDVPFGDPALEKMSLNLLANDDRVSDQLRTNELSLKPSITQVLGRWQRVLSVAATHTVTRETVTGRRSTDNLIVPGITYASVPEGYLGESLFSRGLYAELLGSHTALGANANFLRLELQGERVLDLAPRWHLLLRGAVGASAVAGFNDLPGQYRFFAGGDRSVRGFGYNDLSPIGEARDVFGNVIYDTSQTPAVPVLVKVGGRHLITGTVEFERDLPRSLGVAAFFDFGNAIDRFGDPLAYSAGLGFRWRLPGVTLGIDVAQALKAPGFEQLPGPRIHLNISPRL